MWLPEHSLVPSLHLCASLGLILYTFIKLSWCTGQRFQICASLLPLAHNHKTFLVKFLVQQMSQQPLVRFLS